MSTNVSAFCISCMAMGLIHDEGWGYMSEDPSQKQTCWQDGACWLNMNKESGFAPFLPFPVFQPPLKGVITGTWRWEVWRNKHLRLQTAWRSHHVVGLSRNKVPLQGDSAQTPTISNKRSFTFEDLEVICRLNYYSKVPSNASVNRLWLHKLELDTHSHIGQYFKHNSFYQ